MTVVGGPASVYNQGPESGANQYPGPTYSAKVYVMVVGNITTTVNKGRWAGRANEQFISLDVYDASPPPSSCSKFSIVEQKYDV